MSCADIQGVRMVDDAYAYEAEITANIEISEPLLHRLGGFVCATTFNPTNSFNIRGKGNVPAGILIGGSPSIVGLDEGVTIITNIEEEQAGGEYFDYSYSGTNYPDAENPE